MEKRVLIAIALSFLVLGFYPVILQKIYPNYKPGSGLYEKTAGKSRALETPGVTPAISSPSGTYAVDQDFTLRNDKFSLVLNKKGGVIREVSFFGYTDSETKAPLKILSDTSVVRSPGFLDIASSLSGLGKPAGVYEIQDEAGRVRLSAASLDGKLKTTKLYSFENKKYHGRLTVRFQNTSDAPLEFYYCLYAGASLPPRHSIDEQYIEANIFPAEEGKNQIQHVKETKAGKTVQSRHFVDWVATKDRHFSIILKPVSKSAFKGLVQGLGSHRFDVSLLSEKVSLPPGGWLESEFLMYIGPNEIEELLPLGLDPLVNFGKLDMIGKALVGGLELLHSVFKNYGLSIILLTFLINLLLFPLTRAGYMSMKRMQVIQPQMAKVREHNKKNPEKMNREMMELYKKHKVNPFGGCFPMLLQMPVFIALYVALSKSVILVNSHFLWVNDLSSPDSVYLPVSLPFLGNKIHVLPLVMVAAMVIQQKFTQIKMEGQDPAMETQQKMMALMMPVIFGFIFYSMPSGLVLYWLTNTILMSLYQLHLKKVTLT
ncbi:MAG: hypothetical protein A3C47_00215 [Omnitrophica bacterium RIFCSPHIGHO2_02_FULL_51_18]|nr:MAG: hypothetical protein A3C47_00215 [Omnitrophica bacterium RIFCSPHIGHO2_02_FULL_51_18]